MGTVYAEITLKNVADEVKFREGLIGEQDIRTLTVTSVVDTGAGSLVINEELCQKLGLVIKEERNVGMADGRWVAAKLTEAVEVCWKDRQWPCAAIVIPGAKHVLLGAIPLEGMDLMVHPKTQELAGIHGDTAEFMAF